MLSVLNFISGLSFDCSLLFFTKFDNIFGAGLAKFVNVFGVDFPDYVESLDLYMSAILLVTFDFILVFLSGIL